MLRLVLSPQWFLTPDIAIDFFSFLVLLAFAIISLKYYRLSKNKRFVFLGLAFLLVGLGELAKIIMNMGLYYDFKVTYQVGKIAVDVVKSIDIIYYIGFFFHRFLVMLGFYFIYYITKKRRSNIEHLLILYFIIISAIFSSNAFFIFNITVALLLTIIFINYQSIYKETKSINTKILSAGFLILIMSHLIMVLSSINSNIYIAANILQLSAYMVFLYVIIRIYKHNENRKFSSIQTKKSKISGTRKSAKIFAASKKFKHGKKK